jgi:hypothetical protein
MDIVVTTYFIGSNPPPPPNAPNLGENKTKKFHIYTNESLSNTQHFPCDRLSEGSQEKLTYKLNVLTSFAAPLL